jgi:hypothetical protein
MMRQTILIFLLMMNLSAIAADANTTVVKGYLLDVACYERLKAKGHLELGTAMHSRACLQIRYCANNGYGVLTDKNSFLRFDAESNEQVKKFIAGFTKETDIKVTVIGKVEGDKMTVSKIELQ